MPNTHHSQKIRGQIDLGDGNSLVFSIVNSSKYVNKFLDIRQYIERPDGGYKGFTKKGVRISSENYPLFLKLVKNLEKEIMEGME